jgi:hypothetical protein
MPELFLPGHVIKREAFGQHKVICWWCDSFIRGDKNADEDHTNYDVCSRCKRVQLEAVEQLRKKRGKT